MITGIGMDLVEIDRIRRMLEGQAGSRFMERVLTERERELARGKGGRLAEFVAGRFAAKEAAVKALGCGIGAKAGFQDVEIVPGEDGRPLCKLSAAARERLGEGELLRLHVTITHTGQLAAAYAVAERMEARK